PEHAKRVELTVASSVQDEAGAQSDGSAHDTSRRYAAALFAAVIVFAALFILWYGRYGWFRGDEWAFLTSRDGGSIDGLFQAYNGHWSTIPVIEWRVLFNVFGLRSYRPYLLLIVATHLVAAVLLWITIRRANVNPWIATAAASAFALFG